MSINWLNQTRNALLDLMLPPRCVHCQDADQWLCQACFEKIDFIQPPVCTRCGTPLDPRLSGCEECERNQLVAIDGIRSAAHFLDNPIRSAILQLKYQNHKAIGSTLAQILSSSYRKYGIAADVIIPVPLHKSRFKERGYNQCELLARPLGEMLGLPVNTHSLRRVKRTKTQMTLAQSERHQNVRGAFDCTGCDLADLTILLIDDVCTTGSTLDSCATALKASAVTAVWGLTLVRAQ